MMALASKPGEQQYWIPKLLCVTGPYNAIEADKVKTEFWAYMVCMGQLGHEYCVHNGFNRSHAGKYVYSLATFISWILIYFY